MMYNQFLGLVSDLLVGQHIRTGGINTVIPTSKKMSSYLLPFLFGENMFTCSVEECGNCNRIRRGFCDKHYDNLRKYGSHISPHTKSVKQRLDEKYEIIPESGCWIWVAALNKFGYGKFQLKSNTTVAAHRASWMVYCGEIPGGLYVCHKCDIKSCVNPNHLFLGTAKDNTQDMINKGRNGKGYTRTRAMYKRLVFA